MKKITLAAALCFALISQAQTKRPDNWFNLDATKNNVNGVSTERTYEELLKGKKSTTIIVGVLDSGVDYTHEDLKDVMWTNPGEIAGNGIDDDKNGYIDDIHGWNFIGGKDGKNVEKDNLELTRVYKDLNAKYSGKTEADLKSKDEKKEFKLYQIVKADYDKEAADAEATANQYKFIREAVVGVLDKIKKEKGVDKVTLDDLKKFDAKEQKDKQGKMIAMAQAAAGMEPEELVSQLDEALKGMDGSRLDTKLDTRSIVGDNYSDMTEKYYGNGDCKGPGAFHGTHVAGIIAASRKNNIGMDGVADNVRIMSVRCVPDGDERDKDIANAIRYAVDNGAVILNMSFGKKYSPGKKVVDDAVKYAESKGVLLIHAAGNASEDIDEIVHYPCKKLENGKIPSNFIDIGALSWKGGDEIVAPFSNYGKKTVDIFAPGVDIYSTVPDLNQYKDASGTSMAAPVVAGVAAVLKSYFPELTPKQIIKILTKSSVKTYKDAKVIKPEASRKGDELVKFSELSKTGGIVNLYEAVKMAQGMVKVKG
ncbi:MAG: S8 family serine peptidase [Bacteroidota bacterium]